MNSAPMAYAKGIMLLLLAPSAAFVVGNAPSRAPSRFIAPDMRLKLQFWKKESAEDLARKAWLARQNLPSYGPSSKKSSGLKLNFWRKDGFPEAKLDGAVVPTELPAPAANEAEGGS